MGTETHTLGPITATRVGDGAQLTCTHCKRSHRINRRLDLFLAALLKFRMAHGACGNSEGVRQ